MNCLADTEPQAKEQVLTRYQPFSALLLSHQRQAIFNPIYERETLKSQVFPFVAQQCAAIIRRNQPLSLRIALPICVSPLGFGESIPNRQPEKEANVEVDHLCPWLPSYDPLHRLADFLLWYPEPVWLLFRLRPHPRPKQEDKFFLNVVRHCEGILSESLKMGETVLSRQATSLRDFYLHRLMELSQWKIQVSAYLATTNLLDQGIQEMVANSFFWSPKIKGDELELRGGARLIRVDAEEMQDPEFYPDGHAFSAPEAACVFRLPWPAKSELPGFSLKRWRSAFADLPTGNSARGPLITLGLNIHRGITQPVHVSVEDRLRHMFIVGQTGTGKSTILEHLVLQDLKAGRGICLIDPHGELVEAVLHKYSPERQEDLVIIDFTDTDYPFALNLLAWNHPDERDRIIDDLYNAVGRMYDLHAVGGPIFEKHFRGMLRLLMGEHKRNFTPTLLEFPWLYTNERFRRICLKGIKDEGIRLFVKEVENTRGDYSLSNISQYITSKFSRFSEDQRLQRIFGQEKLSPDFSGAMDEGKVVLINLGKGLFGPTVSALVAHQLVARFQSATMARAQVSPEKRRDFFLYVDECHNVIHESFAELLAEARKYRLGLVLCTQYTEQLQRDWVGRRDTLLSGILGNVGMILSFRLGLEDAQILAGVFAPIFSKHDLLELPNWEGYLKLHLGSSNIPALNLWTIPPKFIRNPDKVEQLRDLSRKRYCLRGQEVDEAINQRWEKFHLVSSSVLLDSNLR